MKAIGVLLILACLDGRAVNGAEAKVLISGAQKENNLVSKLVEAASISGPGTSFSFARRGDGWIFISATIAGDGNVAVILEDLAKTDAVIDHRAVLSHPAEGVRYVKNGPHRIHVRCEGTARVERLVVKAIPELIQSGLGFDPAIKAFGHYDMDFSRKDVLPNITTFFVPASLKLPQPVVDDWHRQGKRFIVEFGIDPKSKTAEEHAAYWTQLLEQVPFADGFIIDEFIINRPYAPERRPPLDAQIDTRFEAESIPSDNGSATGIPSMNRRLSDSGPTRG